MIHVNLCKCMKEKQAVSNQKFSFSTRSSRQMFWFLMPRKKTSEVQAKKGINRKKKKKISKTKQKVFQETFGGFLFKDTFVRF